MRKQALSSGISEEANSLQNALTLISELRDRIERLEHEVFPYGFDLRYGQQGQPRKGRKPKLDTKELLRRRMALTMWLEQNWPRLLGPMREAEASGEPSVAILAIIRAKKNGMDGVFQPPFYDSPHTYQDALGSFLASGRYHGNPKNLASAMAGLPELSWKRSFDLCSKFPDKTIHAVQAYWDYMRRKFPDRLRELSKATTTEEVAAVLARSRTYDLTYCHLKDNPDKVKEWLEAGKPRSSKH